MLMLYLARHSAAARKSYSVFSWAASVARSLRVLRWPATHRQLCELPLFQRYVAPDSDGDVFHHLSHRDYLSRHLTPRQRVACVLSHYRFENDNFDDDYHRAIYGGPGLALWEHRQGGQLYSIILRSRQRHLGEGDLQVALYVGDELLHRIGFSWVNGKIAGLDCPVLPFIARNQGRWRDAHTERLYEQFEEIFPHNSPAYFCAAAMQGLAIFAQADHLICVKGELALAFKRGESSYSHAYDQFWDAFGGVRPAAKCHVIPVPFQLKPLAEVASKHRKRAMVRRACWQEIADAACAVLAKHRAAQALQTQGQESRSLVPDVM